ncbi:hypothetical protein HanRHA438_Chr11g0509761 [Helianthus annuus]|nr:hypothetical protein HanIR_Chr11g0535281 [Helianthus annuus]KAJ0871229.1 hypothetical protein HanRHA438_Chr11g0509761 [Helianthus annuus]
MQRPSTHDANKIASKHGCNNIYIINQQSSLANFHKQKNMVKVKIYIRSFLRIFVPELELRLFLRGKELVMLVLSRI